MKTKFYTTIMLFLVIAGFSQLSAQVLPCNPPTGTNTTNITSHSATANWNTVSGAVIYNVKYRIQAQPNNAWTVVTTQTNHLNLVNLTCNATYEWKVQAGCPGLNGAITLSNFSIANVFTTQACVNVCPVPTGLFASNITNSSATLNWNNTGASNYRVRYRKLGTTTWSLKYPTNNQVNVTGLLSASAYEWQVRSKCIFPSGVVLSAWSNTSIFQTPGVNNCPVPTALTSTSAGTVNSRVLAWNSTGASSYNIRYRQANTAVWTNTTSNTNSKTITGLQQNASYEWQVQSVCMVNGAIVVSGWSASAFFTTQSPMNLSPNPAAEKMFLSYQSRDEQPITVTIHDYMGSPLQSEARKAYSGSNEFELNIAGLKNGFYYVVITTSEGQEASRFCVKK